MKSNITTNKNSKQALTKSKNLMNLAEKILAKGASKVLDTDESWMQRLWDWADENEINKEDLPRDKQKLYNMKSLGLEFSGAAILPEEIGNLVKLEGLYLHDFLELPNSISNLTNLKYLTLIWYYCENNITNQEHLEKWINKLKANGCDVFQDCDYH